MRGEVARHAPVACPDYRAQWTVDECLGRPIQEPPRSPRTCGSDGLSPPAADRDGRTTSYTSSFDPASGFASGSWSCARRCSEGVLQSRRKVTNLLDIERA